MKDLSTRDEYLELVKTLGNYPDSKIALEKLLIRLKFKAKGLIESSIFTLNMKSFGEYTHSNIGNIVFIHEYIRFIRNGSKENESYILSGGR